MPSRRLNCFRICRQALPKRFHRLKFLFNSQLRDRCSNLFDAHVKSLRWKAFACNRLHLRAKAIELLKRREKWEGKNGVPSKLLTFAAETQATTPRQLK